MTEEGRATEIALLKRDIGELRKKEQENATRIDELEAQDKSRMRWAIGALGAVCLSLFTYIWTFKVDGK